MNDAAERINADLHALAFPRAVGGPGEPRARQWLQTRLRDLGLTPTERPFQYSLDLPLAHLRTGMAMLALALAGSAATTAIWGWPGLLVFPLFAAAGAVELRRGLFDDASLAIDDGGERTTANLLARIGTPSVRRVVLVAHYDSKSQNISFAWRALAYLLAFVGLLALPGVLHPTLSWVALGVAMVGALALRQLGRITFEDRSPGALDNAASVAIVLEVAQRLARDPPPETEIWIVFTGAEEHLMAGARVVARDHAAVWMAGQTLVINHDGAGGPGPVGVCGPVAWTRWAQQCGANAGVAVRRIALPIGTATDALPLRAVGLDVFTVTSGALGRAVRTIHTPQDVPENLDPQALAQAAQLTESLVRAYGT